MPSTTNRCVYDILTELPVRVTPVGVHPNYDLWSIEWDPGTGIYLFLGTAKLIGGVLELGSVGSPHSDPDERTVQISLADTEIAERVSGWLDVEACMAYEFYKITGYRQRPNES